MAVSKNITLRLKENELEYFSRIAEREKITRTVLIKKAVYAYGERENNNSPIDKATEVLRHNSNVPGLSHPFLKKIINEGLEVKDEAGNTIAKITDLPKLLTFVQSKVFVNANS